jgi:hypothetical protein
VILNLQTILPLLWILLVVLIQKYLYISSSTDACSTLSHIASSTDESVSSKLAHGAEARSRLTGGPL